MDAATGMLLLALALFALKHFVADFVLQTAWMVKGKAVYGHPGGFAHAGIHMLGSLPVLALMGIAPLGIMLLLLAEGLAHYHIDWSKEALLRHFATNMHGRPFWNLVGADQLLHHLTYLGMIVFALHLDA